ncbi:NUDIX domain-containing protein [Streptomyces sp. NPDC048438]|uniref:NUDIX domain-containing protein n=1 Tax=Streptomyces sp. NPDC048438 TaxID=3365551 RepID=UPI00371F0D70
MSSSLPPPARAASQSVLSTAQNAATRHAVWLGAAAIITDQVGRVLLVHPTYHEDDRWLLPGGVVEPGEHPLATCRREITEELGLTDLPVADVLAVHSLSSHHAEIRLGMPCPGEIRYVFDGGTLTADQVETICLPREELSEFAFFETRDAVQRLRPVDGQIMLAAYRARLGNTATAHLADGRHTLDVPPLDHHDVHVRFRPMWDSPLNRGPVPERLPVQQAWAWCFVPDVMQAECVSIRLVSQAGHVTTPSPPSDSPTATAAGRPRPTAPSRQPAHRARPRAPTGQHDHVSQTSAKDGTLDGLRQDRILMRLFGISEKTPCATPASPIRRRPLSFPDGRSENDSGGASRSFRTTPPASAAQTRTAAVADSVAAVPRAAR